MLIPQKKPVPILSFEAFTGDFITEKVDEEKERIKKLISSSLIDLSEKLEPPPVAMHIKAEKGQMMFFTKGNFSVVTGVAKGRKSYLISMLLAAAIKGNFQDFFTCSDKGTNILFDTEQSKYKVQQITKRINELSENTFLSNFVVYSLRSKEPSERLEIIGEVLATTPNINFIAIDGIGDLANDPILQVEQAQQIITKLMQWTENYNIHIVCVLHYNKTNPSMLGHIGSFAHRKAEAIIEVAKDKVDKNISIVRAVDCREKEFESFAFSVDEDGIPCLLNDYIPGKKSKTDKVSKTRKPDFKFSELDGESHKEILRSVFRNKKEQSYDDCWRNIKNSTQIIVGKSIADNRAKEYLIHYQSTREIVRIERVNKKAVYVLPDQKDDDFELPV